MANETVQRMLQTPVDTTIVPEHVLRDAEISADSTIADLLRFDSEENSPSKQALLVVLDILRDIKRGQFAPDKARDFIQTYEQVVQRLDTEIDTVDIDEGLGRLKTEEAIVLRMRLYARKLNLTKYIQVLNDELPEKGTEASVASAEPESTDVAGSAEKVAATVAVPPEAKKRKPRTKKAPPEMPPLAMERTPLDDLLDEITADAFDQRSEDEKEEILTQAQRQIALERVKLNVKLRRVKLTADELRRKETFNEVEEYLKEELDRLQSKKQSPDPSAVEPSPITLETPATLPEIDTLFSVEEAMLLKLVLFPTSPLKDELFSVLKKMKGAVDSFSIAPRANSRAKDIFTQARRVISEAFDYANYSRNVADMSLEQLLDEMDSKNVNPDAHAQYEQPNADRRLVDLYTEFNHRKAPKSGETPPEQLARIEAIVGWKLQRAESENQNEGQIPSCTRADLFPVMRKRAIERDELLICSTCHPEHGQAISQMLRHLVWIIAQKKHPELNYDNLTKANGRVTMKTYTEKAFEAQLLGLGSPSPDALSGLSTEQQAKSKDLMVGEIYRSLPPEQRKKKVSEVISLTLRLFYLFDLLTVSFAELQKQTKTRSHDQQKDGAPTTDKDRVLISRPDTALVHRSQRYSSDSDWSQWWLPLMSSIPPDYGRDGDPAKHDELVETQKKLIASLNAYFDTSKFTGGNGIPPSDLFNPLFPDTLSYLTLQEGEKLVIGDSVWGRDRDRVVRLGKIGSVAAGEVTPLKDKSVFFNRENFIIAETGWEKMLELTLGSLPPSISETEILEAASGFPTGLIDEMIGKAAGLAKMFPGNHMKRGLVPIFTLYLGRIFMRFEDTGSSRQSIFESVVAKLRESAKGGLKDFEPQILEVIERISDNSHGKKLGRMLEYSVKGRPQQRAEALDLIWKENHWSIPTIKTYGVSSLLAGLNFDPIVKQQQQEYLAAMNGLAPIPSIGVTRKGDLLRKSETK